MGNYLAVKSKNKFYGEQGILLADRYLLTALLHQSALGDLYRAQDQKTLTSEALENEILVFLVNPTLTQLPNFKETLHRVLGEYVKHGEFEPQILDYGQDHQHTWLIFPYLEGVLLSEELKRLGRIGLTKEESFSNIEAILTAVKRTPLKESYGYLEPSCILFHNKQCILLNAPVAVALTILANGSPSIKGRLSLQSSFISPDVAMGEKATPAADTFSVGAILYYMLNGHWPFALDSSLEAILKKTEPATVIKLEPEHWQVLKHSLSFQKEVRQPSPEDLLFQLNQTPTKKNRLFSPFKLIGLVLVSSLVAALGYIGINKIGTSEEQSLVSKKTSELNPIIAAKQNNAINVAENTPLTEKDKTTNSNTIDNSNVVPATAQTEAQNSHSIEPTLATNAITDTVSEATTTPDITIEPVAVDTIVAQPHVEANHLNSGALSLAQQTSLTVEKYQKELELANQQLLEFQQKQQALEAANKKLQEEYEKQKESETKKQQLTDIEKLQKELDLVNQRLLESQTQQQKVIQRNPTVATVPIPEPSPLPTRSIPDADLESQPRSSGSDFQDDKTLQKAKQAYNDTIVNQPINVPPIVTPTAITRKVETFTQPLEHNFNNNQLTNRANSQPKTNYNNPITSTDTIPKPSTKPINVEKARMVYSAVPGEVRFTNPRLFGQIQPHLQASANQDCRSIGAIRAIGFHPKAIDLTGQIFPSYYCQFSDTPSDHAELIGSSPSATSPRLTTRKVLTWDKPQLFGPIPAQLQTRGNSICQKAGLHKATGYYAHTIDEKGQPMPQGGYLCN